MGLRTAVFHPAHHLCSAMRMVVRYTGRVQGVGFRATVVGLARGLAVSGWVRNEDDGSVRLEVQGEEGEVEGLRERVRERLGGFVEVERAERVGKVEGERGFVVAK